jgi:transposase
MIATQHPAPTGLLTRREVQERLKVSRATLKRWAHEGRLVGVRLSPHVLRYAPEAVAAFLRNGYKPSAPDKPGPKPQLQNTTNAPA